MIEVFSVFSLNYKVLVTEFTNNKSLYLLLKQARSCSDVVQVVSFLMPRVCLNVWRFVAIRLPQGHLEGCLKHVFKAGSVNYKAGCTSIPCVTTESYTQHHREVLL